MRPVALLAFAAAVSAAQLPLASSEPDMEPYSETIMSTLSASNKHGTFVHLLQRSKLVPMLSRFNGSIFAPTDAAWKAWEDAHRPDTDERVHGWLGTSGLAEWLLNDDEAEAALARRVAAAGVDGPRVRAEADNQNWAMRQHLLYHILNYTLTERDWAPREENNITIETTLLFPMGKEPAPSPIPPPGTPWTPTHGQGLLGSHGQRLRVALPGSVEGGDRGLVGFDHFGKNGACVWDGSGWENDPNNTHIWTGRDPDTDKNKDRKKERGVRWVRNGVVIGLDGVLAPPSSLLDTLRNTPQLAYLAQLLDVPQETQLPLPPSLDEAKHVTLFVASEDAFTTAFDDLERGYLRGLFGIEGLSRVLAPGTILVLDDKHPVGWSDMWSKKGTNVSSASDILEVTGKNGSLSVNGTTAEVVDIFTANGVIHIMPNVILPEGFELLNSAEKVLLSRNATRFVSLMRSANLSVRYIGEPGKKAKRGFTILAPTDDAIDYMGYLGSQGVLPLELSGLFPQSIAGPLGLSSVPGPPADDTSPLAQLLKYHILAGSYAPDDVKDDMLIPTELSTAELGGARQPIRVEVSERRMSGATWDVEVGEISFGGASVVGQPVKSGDTIIYFMSEILAPPLDTLQTAIGDLQLSTYIAAVYAAGLERSIKKNPATTYFLPRNKAFNNLGLAMKYLLLPEGRDELRKVLRYHAVEQLLYTRDVEVGLTVLKTMEGGNILLDRSDNNNYTLRSPSQWPKHDSGSASVPSNGDLRPAVLRAHNALTETGVIHIIDSVVLPADVKINIAKLIRGSKQHTMPELLVKAGFGWILEGRQPTDEEVSDLGLPGDFRTLGKSKNGKGDGNANPDDLAQPAYTVLVPTDKAFSRINMTYYFSDPEALKRLLKLHIIPSNLGASLPKGSSEHGPRQPPADNTPLALEDDVVYPTLLVFESQYGEVGFRAQGDDDFLVGVRNARGGSSDRPARTGPAGRASVRWEAAKQSIIGILSTTSIHSDAHTADDPASTPLWRGGMTLGGGVIVIDAVLEPYDPPWFTRWGWLVLTVFGTVAVVSLAGVSVWWWWATTKKKQEGYERLATAQEEARQEEENRHWRRTSRETPIIDQLHEHCSMSDSPSDQHADTAAPVNATATAPPNPPSTNTNTDPTAPPAVLAKLASPSAAPPTDTASHNEDRSTQPAPATERDGAPSAADGASKPEEKKDDADNHTLADAVHAPADTVTHPPVVASAVRVPTPSSRTSTPPLAAHAKKKFSSVSVTKEFLSKAASPVPAPAKLVRPAAVATPAQTTSKLLSSKLTTVPSSKPSTSPKPPASGSASAPSAPWAKPVAPFEAAPTLQHPAPTRTAMPNVAMGSGQGLGAAARRAWGSVGASERRGPPTGLSREFPTAKEVADGKRKAMLSAQAVAQAEAAHNQAILDDLNVFTHLEPNAHRWDEEDEDDDMIDFGDGRTYSSFGHAAENRDHLDQPVTKSERFGDDFDRSWPKRDEQRSRQEQGRVLFNASSNRLEPHARGLPTQSQPRLVPRDAPRQDRDRALPPHLEAGRALPPHMAHSASPGSVGYAASRPSWRAGPTDRDPGHHAGEHRERHRELPVRDPPARSPPAERAPLPPIHATALAREPAAKLPPPPAAAPPAVVAPTPSGQAQAEEMHTAAEKARMRRVAEEADREAAAERARQKARELAERFGPTPPKPAAPTASAAVPAPSSALPPPPPGLSKAIPPPPGFAKSVQQTQPQITLAPRPKDLTSPQAPITGLPQPPELKSTAADRASSWRRTEPLQELPQQQPVDRLADRRPSHDQGRFTDIPRELRRGARDLPPHPLREVSPHTQQLPISSQGRDREEAPRSPNRPKAPPGLEQPRPHGFGQIASPHPSKREANFDTMLARIQAAMAQSRPLALDGKVSDDSASPDGDKQKSPVEAVKDVAPPAPVPTPAHALATPNGLPAEKTPAQQTPAPSRPRKAAPAPLPHLPPDYFDATQAPIPPSPPPAWRLYNVKLPKATPPNKDPLPRSRLRAAEAKNQAPRGWTQTFDPPLEPYAHSRVLADVLLPQPMGGRRFVKPVDTGLIVSLSHRKLVPYQRKPKQRLVEQRVLPGGALSFGKPTRPAPPEPAQTAVTASQPARKLGKARIAVPGPQAESIPADGAKPPAVRFMVSSELDGDSLLDEINKMSLEHLGEVEDKGLIEPKDLVEKPGTPPPAPVSAPRTNPTSPSNPIPGPWAKSTLAYSVTSPARDDPQREHLKSVWEQAADTNVASSSAPVPAPSQPETPLYPTLNSPATAPDPASLKPVYPMGQSAFGARGQFGQSYSQFSGATSPDGGMGVQYGIMGRGQTAGNANGFQQGLWAPSPSFGNSLSGGYAYQKPPEKPTTFAKDANPNFTGDFRYPANSNQAFQGNYNGYQYRNPQQSYGHVGYGHTGFGTQMAGPRANTQSRFMGNGEFPMGYDANYYSGHAGQHPAGYSNGGGMEQPRPGRKMW
ncbi:hypothetical protein CcaverHIS631_0405640 [Cutaneotrichosporon cavernicola]|nr:hypothetical protein CcaverHIS631_0405640 [Cutaneotrichosporon cavernicola]